MYIFSAQTMHGLRSISEIRMPRMFRQQLGLGKHRLLFGLSEDGASAREAETSSAEQIGSVSRLFDVAGSLQTAETLHGVVRSHLHRDVALRGVRQVRRRPRGTVVLLRFDGR